jgi:MFS family permease
MSISCFQSFWKFPRQGGVNGEIVEALSAAVAVGVPIMAGEHNGVMPVTESAFLTRPFVYLNLVTLLASISVYEAYLYPDYLRAQQMDEGKIGLAMGAFYFGSLVAMPFAAHAVRRLGSRLVIGAGLLCIGAVFMALDNLSALPLVVAVRFLHGIGWSVVVVPSTLLATLLVPPDRLNQGVALHGSCFLIGQAVGPWLAASLVGWTGNFSFVFLSAAAVAFCGLLFVGPLSANIPSASGFRSDALPLRRVVAPLLSTLLITAGFGAATSFVADYSNLLGMGLAVTGFFYGQLAGGLLVRFVAGRILDVVPKLAAIVLGSIAMTGGLLFLWHLHHVWQLWIAGALTGISTSIYFSPLQALVIQRSADRITAVTAFRGVVNLSVSVSSISGGFIAVHFGYLGMFLLMAVLAMIGSAVTIMDGISNASPARKESRFRPADRTEVSPRN